MSNIKEWIETKLKRVLFNEHKSILTQLSVSFTTLLIVSASVTIGICYGLLIALSTGTYDSAESYIISSSKSNCQNLADEVAAVLDKQLSIIGNSIIKGNSLFTYNLLSYASQTNTSGALEPARSYREYNFVAGCSISNYECPIDFGDMEAKSRVPYTDGFYNGSMEHTSVQLFSSSLNRAARNDTDWDYATSDYPVRAVINSLARQDLDFSLLYEMGPTSTMFFYSSVQLKYSGDYHSIHRTYPGFTKNASDYDAAERSWFKYAPVDYVSIYGPYKETFTGQYTITLSSAQKYSDSDFNDNFGGMYEAKIVSAAVVRLDTIEEILRTVRFSSTGFVALVTYTEHFVIAWKQNTTVYNDTGEGSFKTLTEIEPAFDKYEHLLYKKRSFQFTDSDDLEWIVSAAPFFESGSENSDGETEISEYSFVVLVFIPKSEVLSSLPVLRDNIHSTTQNVFNATGLVLAIANATAFVLSILLILYITIPLVTMQDLSTKIIRVSAEDEETALKDYSQILGNNFFGSSRRDEIGVLMTDFYNAVCVLNNKTVAKRNKPKYPPNPFHVVAESKTPNKFRDFYIALVGKSTAHTKNVSNVAEKNEGDNLDVLSHFLSELKTAHAPTEPTVTTADDIEMNLDKDDAINIANGVEMTTYRKVVATEEMEIAAIELFERKNSTLFTSLKSYLYCITFVLLSCCIVVMVYTVVILNEQGSSWMTETSVVLEYNQMSNLEEIAALKGLYVQSWLHKISTELDLLGNYASSTLDGNISYNSSNNYFFHIDSYALDQDNDYSINSDLSKNFSGYYNSDWLGCNTSSCAYTQTNNETKMTSLLDLKFRSLFYSGYDTKDFQMGLESGFYRNYPYEVSSKYSSSPSSCYVDDTTLYTECEDAYNECSTVSTVGNGYPDFNPRCRSWYSYGVRNASLSKYTYFQYPRVSSSGAYTITAVKQLKRNDESMYGILNSLTLVESLQSSVNELTILGSGYAYIVDAFSPQYVIMHPNVDNPSVCRFVACAEKGMTSSEYDNFYENFLLKIQNLAATGSNDTTGIPTSYRKDGTEWRIKVAIIVEETYTYAVIATVSQKEVIKVSIEVQNKIDSTVDGMIAGFVISIVAFVVLLLFFINLVIKNIIFPIEEISNICVSIARDDISKDISTDASSLDMKLLLKAFENVLVALRFGSENYARGNISLAQDAFTKALALFTATNNNKGIGASHNNLGGTYMAFGNFDKSFYHYSEAIRLCEEAIKNAKEGDNISRLRRLLSDRKGNLVSMELERNNFTTAFNSLEILLTEDKKLSYIRGCVVKQGILGQWYLRQKEYSSAEKVFNTALEFIRTKDLRLYNSATQWNQDECDAAEQIALFNYSTLYIAQNKFADAESKLIEALSSTSKMHLTTVVKILSCLSDTLSDPKDKENLLALAQKYNLTLLNSKNSNQKGGAHGQRKRVIFAVDYSGSMSGSKIKSAVQNIKDITENHVHGDDMIQIIQFNSLVKVLFPLQPKAGNESTLKHIIEGMNSPNDSTAFYDAVISALTDLDKNKTNNDWIIVLTDGADSSSSSSQSQVLSIIKSKGKQCPNLIIIGVGDDVETTLLTQLAISTAKGMYIGAASDKKSIDEAFGKVVQAIQAANIVMEDL